MLPGVLLITGLLQLTAHFATLAETLPGQSSDRSRRYQALENVDGAGGEKRDDQKR